MSSRSGGRRGPGYDPQPETVDCPDLHHEIPLLVCGKKQANGEFTCRHGRGAADDNQPCQHYRTVKPMRAWEAHCSAVCNQFPGLTQRAEGSIFAQEAWEEAHSKEENQPLWKDA